MSNAHDQLGNEELVRKNSFPSAANAGERELGPRPGGVQNAGQYNETFPADVNGPGSVKVESGKTSLYGEEKTLPTPPTWNREAPGTTRAFNAEASYTEPRRVGGDPMPGIEQKPAPVAGLRAVEYVPRPSNLPLSVSQAQIARECAARGDNQWTADDPAGGPILSGTRVTGSK